MLTEAEFRAYCEAMATSPAWGGQVELKALASVLQAPIQVIMGPTLKPEMWIPVCRWLVLIS